MSPHLAPLATPSQSHLYIQTHVRVPVSSVPPDPKYLRLRLSLAPHNFGDAELFCSFLALLHFSDWQMAGGKPCKRDGDVITVSERSMMTLVILKIGAKDCLKRDYLPSLEPPWRQWRLSWKGDRNSTFSRAIISFSILCFSILTTCCPIFPSLLVCRFIISSERCE